MASFIHKRVFQGFMCLHILHHALHEPIYGSWMMEELARHGYRTGPGTLYPLLHDMVQEGLLTCESVNVNGKVRKYYRATAAGGEALQMARTRLRELTREIGMQEGENSR